DPIALNGTATYTVTASNNGVSAAANVDVTIAIAGTAGSPTAYVISDPSESGAFCSTDGTSTVTCADITSIAAGEDYQFSFTVTAAQIGQIDVAATVSTDTAESDGTNNTDSESTLVQIPAADLTVATSWDPTTVY